LYTKFRRAVGEERHREEVWLQVQPQQHAHLIQGVDMNWFMVVKALAAGMEAEVVITWAAVD
jgi:hypothetical protein